MKTSRNVWNLGFGQGVAFLLCFASIGASAQAPPRPTRQEITRGLSRYAHEPTASEVVERAIARSELDPARARGLAAQARLSGAAPSVRIGARRDQGRDQTAYQTTNVDSDRWNLSSDDALGLQASLLFRLDRLLFAPEEVPLLREERAIDARRIEVARLAIEIYFLRRRLQLERDLLGEVAVDREVRIVECEAVLDALTGGWFSAEARERRPVEDLPPS